MSAELEKIMARALEGKFYSYAECGAVITTYVSRNFKPSHNLRGFREPRKGELNGKFKAWEREAEDRLFSLRAKGCTWREIGKIVGRSLSSCRWRYIELCRERGIDPLIDVRRLGVKR